MVPVVIFIIGPPGCGKGTQCKYISDTYGFKHISVGQLLRDEQKKVNSEFSAIIKQKMDKCELVPADVTVKLLEKTIHESGGNRILIDGFPRNMENLYAFDLYLSGKTKLLLVLAFGCRKHICVQRILNRGEAGSGRADDNLATAEKRYDKEMKESEPVIKYYEELGILKRVNAEVDAAEVFDYVQELFDASGLEIFKESGTKVQIYKYTNLDAVDLLP